MSKITCVIAAAFVLALSRGQPASAQDTAGVIERLNRLQAEFDEYKRQHQDRDGWPGGLHSEQDASPSALHAPSWFFEENSSWLVAPIDPAAPLKSFSPAGPSAQNLERDTGVLHFVTSNAEQPMPGPVQLQAGEETTSPAGNSSILPIQQTEERPETGGLSSQHPNAPRQFEELGSIRRPEVPSYIPNMPAKKRKVEAEFKEGLTVKTEDGYFSLTFHNLTQVDLRIFDPTGDPLHDNFIVPRQRWYVLGNVSPYVQYYTVINRGYGTLDVLDAWGDFSLGDVDRDKLQIRIGRMKTPYTYEYIKIAENDLIAAERSVYVGNLAPNREIGAMIHGQVCNKQIEYALGVFNGPRRSFEDFNSGKDLFTFLNTKPFLNGCSDLFRELNLGGSFNFGSEHNPAQPFALRTANDQSTSPAAGNVSPTFFRFAPNAFEDGRRMQWAADAAYYYKSFGLLAGYQGGFQDYALSAGILPGVQALRLGTQEFVGVIGGPATRVSSLGYSIAVNYFLTGEEITRRRELLEPRQEYAPASRYGKRRFGAVEAFSRFAYLSLGSNVFAAGLADPGISSNRARVIDSGFNWYLNHYVKLTFDWQYSGYGNPVFLAPGRTTSFNNLFWFRTQIFF